MPVAPNPLLQGNAVANASRSATAQADKPLQAPGDKGDGFGHIAIGVPDLYSLCDKLKAEGVDIPRPAGPLKHGGPNASIIAFVRDPDGYMIELGERA